MKTRNILILIVLAIWLFASLAIGRMLAYDREFRVNNFDVIPGIGSVQRDPEGAIFHVHANGEARKIYPRLAPPSYLDVCNECRVMRENALAGTNDYCAIASRSTLPDVDFQVPCRTGITIDDGPRVMALFIFVIPIIAILIIIGIRRGVFKPRKPGQIKDFDKFDR